MTAPTTSGWLIYLVTNKVNGHRYIGLTMTWRFRKRQSEHGCAARKGYRWPFQAAIRKYGAEAFEFSVLQHCTSQEEACEAEIRLIAEMRPEYNVSKGGDGNSYWAGKKRSPETIEKMRLAMLGRPGYWAGKERSLETKAKVSASKKGKKNPSAIGTMALHGEMLRAAANKARQRPVVCLDDGLCFDSAKEAALYYGAHRSSVTHVIRTNKSLFGKAFAYDESHQ